MSVESAGDGGVAFPLRVGCVDMGFNAIRFVIAEFVNQISGVRDSDNGAAFVERVRAESGIELEVISGSEEAELVRRAVATRVLLSDRQRLLAVLGGGRVEVSLGDQYGTFWRESHTMGSVRLLAKLTEAGADPGRFRRLLEGWSSKKKSQLFSKVFGKKVRLGIVEEQPRSATATS